jgi:hypothetical protein
MMPSGRHLSRIGGVAAILGALVLSVATMLHPLDAHPADTAAAFAEYAADRYWVATHLAQLLGVVLLAAGLVALSWHLRAGRAGAWALLAGLAAVASVALAAALQAVDGVALKVMVDRWAAASAEERSAVFEAAFGVRQIEIGLASMMAMLFGLTTLLYGIALLQSAFAGAWLGVLALIGGLATLAAGIIQAHTGFSDLAMAASMPGTALVLVWALCVGVLLLRRPE